MPLDGYLMGFFETADAEMYDIYGEDGDGKQLLRGFRRLCQFFS